MSVDGKRLFAWATSLLLVILGCNIDTRIEYLHDPTEKIETDFNLERPELLPFTLDGVVVAPVFRKLSSNRTQLWLKLWARQEKMVSVRAAQLTGNGAQINESTQFLSEQRTATNQIHSANLRDGQLLLGELSNQTLATLAADGNAKLMIEVRVPPATDYHTLSFFITRHKTKHFATH